MGAKEEHIDAHNKEMEDRYNRRLDKKVDVGFVKMNSKENVERFLKRYEEKEE